MKIVYLIAANKLPEQLIRLVKKLNSKDVFFIIHFDRKAKKEDYKKIKKNLKKYPNIFFTKKRYKCFWGEFGLVKATIQMIKESLERKIPFDYAILLSGQTYPIKSNKHIREFLEKNKEMSFIGAEKFPLRGCYDGGFSRIEKWHFRLFGKKFSFPPENFPVIIKRKFPRRFHVYGGSTWWALNKKHSIYLIDFLKNNPHFFKFFKYVEIPDESIFHTIFMNSNYKDRIILDNLLFEIWISPKANPEILTKKDFEQLKNSDKLFARKFDVNIDSEILYMIDKNLLNKN